MRPLADNDGRAHRPSPTNIEEIMSEISTFLKCLMEEANVSQAELGRLAGVSRTTLSKIMRGRSSGSIAALDKILGVFGCYITVRRRRNQPSDFDKDSGVLRLPFDDPLENNSALDKIRKRVKKTTRPR